MEIRKAGIKSKFDNAVRMLQKLSEQAGWRMIDFTWSGDPDWAPYIGLELTVENVMALVAQQKNYYSALYSGDEEKIQAATKALHDHLEEIRIRPLGFGDVSEKNKLMAFIESDLKIGEDYLGKTTSDILKLTETGDQKTDDSDPDPNNTPFDKYLASRPTILAELSLTPDGNPNSAYGRLKRAYNTYGDYSTGRFDDAFTDYIINKGTLPDGTEITPTQTSQEYDDANLSPQEIAQKMKVSYEKALRNVTKNSNNKEGVVQKYNVGAYQPGGLRTTGIGDNNTRSGSTSGTPVDISASVGGARAQFGITGYGWLGSTAAKIAALNKRLTENITPQEREGITSELFKLNTPADNSGFVAPNPQGDLAQPIAEPISDVGADVNTLGTPPKPANQNINSPDVYSPIFQAWVPQRGLDSIRGREHLYKWTGTTFALK